MAPGGVAIAPQVKKDTGVECNRLISLWPYSDLTDKRVMLGTDYIFLKFDASADVPFKYGMPQDEGWAVYINNNVMFLKEYTPIEGAKYPDYGCSFEAYASSTFFRGRIPVAFGSRAA